jgi:Holliday junction resolvase
VPGLPDLLVYDEKHQFHFVELKHTTNNKVELRPHQVAWLSNHQEGNCWIWVRQKKRSQNKSEFYLYHAKQAVDLRMSGLKVEPFYHCVEPFDWDAILSLTFPH